MDPTTPPISSRMALRVSLWTVQVLLALVFVSSGLIKVLVPLGDLETMMSWVNHVPGWLVRFIGVCELAGAVGLVLPAAVRIRPSLTPLAAALLAVDMALAVAVHLALGEVPMFAVPLTLCALSAFVAWGRSRRAPIAPRRAATSEHPHPGDV